MDRWRKQGNWAPSSLIVWSIICGRQSPPTKLPLSEQQLSDGIAPARPNQDKGLSKFCVEFLAGGCGVPIYTYLWSDISVINKRVYTCTTSFCYAPLHYSVMTSCSKKKSDPFQNIRFTNYTPEDARDAWTTGKKAPLRAARVYNEYLKLSPAQAKTVAQCYKTHQHFEQHFAPNTASQLEARILLEANNLDAGSRESLDDRWSIRWSWERGEEKKTLYQW